MINDSIFNFIYIAAVHDATLQKAYVGKKAWIATETEQAKGMLKKHVEDVLSGKYTESKKTEYDKAFLKLACNISEQINEVGKKLGFEKTNQFTFGNAQKLINITLKYFYILTYQNPAEKAKFSCCHCPMDSILLEEMWDKVESKKNEKMRHKEFCSSWGNEEATIAGGIPKRYEEFQKCIKEYCNEIINPIECDYILWEEAKSKQ